MRALVVCTALTLIVAPSVAHADPQPSILEAGTLARGEVAVRGGIGLAPGMLGIGVQAAVGLGRVDIVGAASLLPACLAIGDGDVCGLAAGTAGLGAQVALLRGTAFRIDARVHVDAGIAGDLREMGMATVLATTGTRRVRFSVGPAAMEYAEDDSSIDDNGWYLGGVARLAIVQPNGRGLEITGGAAGQLRMVRPNVMPLISISYVTTL